MLKQMTESGQALSRRWRIPLFGYACWRPQQGVYRVLINTLLQRGVIGRAAVLNRFSGFHRPKPLKRLKFNGLACTQLKQGVIETSRYGCATTGRRPPASSSETNRRFFSIAFSLAKWYWTRLFPQFQEVSIASAGQTGRLGQFV
jgi:hypothetical protein